MSDHVFSNISFGLLLFAGFVWLVTRTWVPADPFLPIEQEMYEDWDDEDDDESEWHEYAVVVEPREKENE